MTVNLYFEDVAIGDQLTEWTRTTGFMEWNRYAAVNDEFVPFHMEDEAGCQYRAINQQGDVLTVTGTVTDKRVEGDEHCVYLKLNVINQDGKDTCPGHAIVVLPSR